MKRNVRVFVLFNEILWYVCCHECVCLQVKKMTFILSNTLTFKSEHLVKNGAKLVDDLENCYGFLNWMDDFLDPVRYHDQIMNDFPKIVEGLHIETKTVDYILFQREGKISCN